jgi:hypothetical protein
MGMIVYVLKSKSKIYGIWLSRYGAESRMMEGLSIEEYELNRYYDRDEEERKEIINLLGL